MVVTTILAGVHVMNRMVILRVQLFCRPIKNISMHILVKPDSRSSHDTVAGMCQTFRGFDLRYAVYKLPAPYSIGRLHLSKELLF